MISEQPRKMWGGRQYNWTAVHLNVQKKNTVCLFLDTLVPPNSISRHNRTFAGANSFKYVLTLKWSAFFVTLFSFNKVPRKRLEHSRTREKYVSCFPLTILSCFSRFLRALQKNRAHCQGFVIGQLAATLFQLKVFLTRLAVFSGESFHADTLVSIFLVQRNAFTSVLTGRTVAQRLHRGKHIAVSDDHWIAKSKYHWELTWLITLLHPSLRVAL